MFIKKKYDSVFLHFLIKNDVKWYFSENGKRVGNKVDWIYPDLKQSSAALKQVICQCEAIRCIQYVRN
jgi:hypothetical protein